MNHTIYMAYAGLRGRALALDLAANNMANMTTAGFKRQVPFFSILSRSEAPALNPVEKAVNGPVVSAQAVLDLKDGILSETGNPLDVALSGPGFFEIETPQGIRYTRSGTFTLNSSRQLVTRDGFRVGGARMVGPDSGDPNAAEPFVPLTLPQGAVSISQSGQISVDGTGAGTLKIVQFEDPSRLRPAGSTLLEAPDNSPRAVPQGTVVYQGFLEEANVNPIAGVGDMIAVMRSFEMLSRTVRAIDEEVDQQVIDQVGRV